MHHQNVPQKNAPSKRTLLTSFQRSSNLTLHQIWCGLWGQQLLAGVVPLGIFEKRSKEYVLMVHFLWYVLMVHQGPAELVSPDFLPPARCDFSHARKGKWPLSRVFLCKGRFPFLAWEK